MSAQFQIGHKEVGLDAPCFIIAEVGLGHDGSLGTAHAYIDAAADAGVDAVKFQTHIAAAESTPQEQFRVKVFPQDATRYDYWIRTAFTETQWRGLKDHSESRGLEFLSTPFSAAAVELLRGLGIKAWKIGSGETNNPLLLEQVAVGKEPVLLSSGMSYLSELDASIRLLQERKAPVLLMQCTSRYPCPPQQLGLNVISLYRQRYGIPTGFSDHSGEIAPALAAVTLGTNAVEVHLTWHKKSFGPDVKASLTVEQLGELVKGIRIIETAMQSPVDKDHDAKELEAMRTMFNKGLVAARKIPEGTALEHWHIDGRKPCIGIPVAEYKSVLGKRTARELNENDHITWDDLR